MPSKDGSDERIKEVVEYAIAYSDREACDIFSISATTLARYKREFKDRFPEESPEIVRSKLIQEIEANYSDSELRAIAKGGQISPLHKKIPYVDYDGEEITFGAMGDTHMGSVYYQPEFMDMALEQMEKEGCQFIAHVGDVTEGMSNRPGQIYELTHLGYDRQKQLAIDELGKWKGKWYIIDGNHDRWFTKSNGALIVKDICAELPNADFIGHDVGEIALKDKCTIQLRHGESGASYAISYGCQKFIEALPSGNKPNIMLFGHIHKMVYFFDRNIHALCTGALSLCSKYMESKRLAHHAGYWIVKMKVSKTGIVSFNPTWYPFYV